jgi:rhodanese-related sulfurtransferase
MAQTVQRVLVIILVGSVLGLLGNALVPKGIPLVTPPKKAPQPQEFTPLDQAHDLWAGGVTIFLDARSPLDFAAGHIARAINLPVEQFPDYYPKVAPMLAMDSSIVVYCDGKECELSHRLADQLRQMGYSNVHILSNGWTEWSKAGYAVETGAGQ